MFERLISRPRLVSSALLLASFATASCQEKGYRTEVYPGEEGRTTIKRVPIDQPSEPQQQTSTSDAQWATLRSVWPQLSPEDRQRVTDMARRLANPQP